MNNYNAYSNSYGITTDTSTGTTTGNISISPNTFVSTNQPWAEITANQEVNVKVFDFLEKALGLNSNLEKIAIDTAYTYIPSKFLLTLHGDTDTVVDGQSLSDFILYAKLDDKSQLADGARSKKIMSGKTRVYLNRAIKAYSSQGAWSSPSVYGSEYIKFTAPRLFWGHVLTEKILVLDGKLVDGVI